MVALDRKNCNEFYKNNKERIKPIKNKTVVQIKPNPQFLVMYEMKICSQEMHILGHYLLPNKLSKDKINEYIEIPHVNLFRRYHEGNYSKQTKIWQKP